MPSLRTVVPAVLVLVASMLLAPSTQAAKSAAVVTDPRYATAQHLVDIDHGRRLNIFCMGTGSPTVVFDAGLGNWSQIWGLVQPAIAAQVRACAYDRAGLGFSDPATREGSSANIADDLHRLLVAARIKPPYVLVGHSYGGMSMRLYVDLHRDEVVGMVLVDPSTRDFAPPRAAWTADERQRADAEHAEGERHAKTCIAAARAGFVAGSKAFDECIDDAPNPRYSAAINAVYSRLQRTPSFLEARWSEDVAFDTSSADQVRAARRGYGAMPLVVLTQSEAAADPANSGFVRAHDAIAALSSRGVNRIVPESSHSIFFDQPQAVIDAIREVLAATKTAAH